MIKKVKKESYYKIIRTWFPEQSEKFEEQGESIPIVTKGIQNEKAVVTVRRAYDTPALDYRLILFIELKEKFTAEDSIRIISDKCTCIYCGGTAKWDQTMSDYFCDECKSLQIEDEY